MNIKEAREEICNTVRAYLLRDETGRYIYPSVRQRPILLMGPPGVGKTAILEQAAAQCGVGLVSYALTHHTRQSAIGLPRIEKRVYSGREMDVTEYTMSEIVAAVYECMERTGRTEGILFLDEINCVSETLAPTMLQLLQSKCFGSHRLPEGWVLVTAGNPPEYNRAVREFDVATLDRVRQIDIEPDCAVWMEYAIDHGVHGSILSYLGIRPEHFYRVEQGEDGTDFVTARGWEDLSELIRGYETLDVPFTAAVAAQYLRRDDIAKSFAAYYQLYRQYGTDYAIPSLLAGQLDEPSRGAKIQMAGQGGFEERLTVVQLILDYLSSGFRRYARTDRRTTTLHQALTQLRNRWTEPTPISLAEFRHQREESHQVKVRAGLLERPACDAEEWVIETLRRYEVLLKQQRLGEDMAGFDALRAEFQKEVRNRHTLVRDIQGWLEQAFSFVLDSFGDGQELLLLVSGLTRSPLAAAFLSEHVCPVYLQYSEKLLFRQQERCLQEQCGALL